MDLTLDENYTDKSIVLRGESTRIYKDELKDILGGRYNRYLNGGAGWVFPKSKIEKVKDFISIKSFCENFDKDKFSDLSVDSKNFFRKVAKYILDNKEKCTETQIANAENVLNIDNAMPVPDNYHCYEILYLIDDNEHKSLKKILTSKENIKNIEKAFLETISEYIKRDNNYTVSIILKSKELCIQLCTDDINLDLDRDTIESLIIDDKEYICSDIKIQKGVEEIIIRPKDVKSASPRAKSVSPRAKSVSPRTKSASPRTKSASPRAKSTSPRAKSASPRSTSPRASKKYDKEGQKYEDPLPESAVYIYYTSLYREDSKSPLAITWLTEHGVYEGQERKALLDKYRKLSKLIK